MNKIIKEIKKKGKLLALITRQKINKEGVNFLTSEEEFLQLGISIYRKGTKIKPHFHKNRLITVNKIQEVLHIESGKIRVICFDDKNKEAGKAILNCGDTVILLSGGHGFNILQDSKIIEIKQGPYKGVKKDKEYLAV